MLLKPEAKELENFSPSAERKSSLIKQPREEHFSSHRETSKIDSGFASSAACSMFAERTSEEDESAICVNANDPVERVV